MCLWIRGQSNFVQFKQRATVTLNLNVRVSAVIEIFIAFINELLSTYTTTFQCNLITKHVSNFNRTLAYVSTKGRLVLGFRIPI